MASFSWRPARALRASPTVGRTPPAVGGAQRARPDRLKARADLGSRARPDPHEVHATVRNPTLGAQVITEIGTLEIYVSVYLPSNSEESECPG